MNILILRSGLLGDTLVSLPALWALRRAYPEAHIRYVMELDPAVDHVRAEEVLGSSGLVDSFDYFIHSVSAVRRLSAQAALLLRLRRTRWNLGISLAEPFWSARKKDFIRLCGAKTLLGPEGRGERHPRDKDGRLARLPHIADSLVEVLRPLNISLPGRQAGGMDLSLQTGEEAEAAVWLEKIGAAHDRRPHLALGIWSMMPAKRWPLERFEQVVRALIEEQDVVPFIFGGAGEKEAAQTLAQRLGRGYVVCGELGVRPAAALLKKCALFLGNDTGTMHLAAAAGIPCVTIFSSRDSPGRWDPYGPGHTVFRTWVSCEGCMLRDCTSEKMRCILAITPEEVFASCSRILRGK